jgi:RimJ/RimL family protein N-acetyltransferase
MSPSVRLRDVEPGDLPVFFAHQRDPEAVAMAAFQSRERDAFDKHWAKILADDTCRKQTIIVRCDTAAGPQDRVAGNIGSFMMEGKREVGYWIDRAYWGRGIATAALMAFLRIESTRPLYAGAAKHNAASIRVLQKCGFVLLDDAGADEPHDTHVFLVLR